LLATLERIGRFTPRRRTLVLGVLVLLVAAFGVALGYYFYEGRSRAITGSSTEEFVPTENPADTTTEPPTTTQPGPKPGPSLDAQWPTYGRDVQRTHVSPAKHHPPYRRVWMHRARHYIEFPPAVAYDKVFVAQQRGYFFALDAATGKQLWIKNFHRCAAASPTVWRGVVYQVLMHELPCRKNQAGATGLLIAMNARTGRELWSFRPGAIESSPLIVDGVIYFGSWDRNVYAIDVRTKKVKWRFRTDDKVVAGPAYAHGTIYVPTNSGHIYAINARTGRQRWRNASFSRFGRREYFYATPTVAYGRVFIGNADGYVYSYGATSGKLIWAQRAGTYVYTAAAVWHQTVYVGTWDGWVVAFDAATGKTRWRHDSPGGVSGAPTVMDGLLYYSTLGGFGGRHQRRVEPGANQTFALDARTGKRVWSFPDGAYSPIVADRDRVYLVGRTRVYGLEDKRRSATPAKTVKRKRRLATR
jgi:outer membrane protein assembly factor BamB